MVRALLLKLRTRRFCSDTAGDRVIKEVSRQPHLTPRRAKLTQNLCVELCDLVLEQVK